MIRVALVRWIDAKDIIRYDLVKWLVLVVLRYNCGYWKVVWLWYYSMRWLRWVTYNSIVTIVLVRLNGVWLCCDVLYLLFSAEVRSVIYAGGGYMNGAIMAVNGRNELFKALF